MSDLETLLQSLPIEPERWRLISRHDRVKIINTLLSSILQAIGAVAMTAVILEVDDLNVMTICLDDLSGDDKARIHELATRIATVVGDTLGAEGIVMADDYRDKLS